jgi:hypothetical protein
MDTLNLSGLETWSFFFNLSRGVLLAQRNVTDGIKSVVVVLILDVDKENQVEKRPPRQALPTLLALATASWPWFWHSSISKRSQATASVQFSNTDAVSPIIVDSSRWQTTRRAFLFGRVTSGMIPWTTRKTSFVRVITTP